MLMLFSFLKKILIQSQFYVSLCASLLGVFVLQEQIPNQKPLILILFLTFWNGYFFTVFHKYKDALLVNVVGFGLISFLIFYFLDLHFYIKWLIVLFLGFLYNANFFNINLREFSVLKTFYVGFIWAMSLVWLPLEHSSWVWFAIIFFFISGITFPYEIRDLKVDNIITLPKKIGIQNTKYLSYVFLFISCFIGIAFLPINDSISLFGTVVVSSVLVYFTDEKNPDFYFSVLLETCSALPIAVYWLLQI